MFEDQIVVKFVFLKGSGKLGEIIIKTSNTDMFKNLEFEAYISSRGRNRYRQPKKIHSLDVCTYKIYLVRKNKKHSKNDKKNITL